MQDLSHLDCKQLLACGPVASATLFKAVLKDRDRLLDETAAERAEKRQLKEA